VTRFKLTLEYDGGGLVGWQRQDNGPSVQALLEDAILALCGESVTAYAAGRTDAGVHALGQVVHFDIAKAITADRVRDALNYHLRPHPIAVLDARRADPGFHARFDAIERRYLYRIVNRRAPLTVDRGRAWQVPVALDARMMHEAAQILVGHYDFSSFRASECQAASPQKTLDALDVERRDSEIRVRARARSFLHHQVRNMVGTLKLVGEGKWSAADVATALAARDRRAAGPTAPAEGLYLEAVRYPEQQGSSDHGVGHGGQGDPDQQVQDHEAECHEAVDGQRSLGDEPLVVEDRDHGEHREDAGQDAERSHDGNRQQ
jgi:tRNA pseudouridine38-40 synthase